MKKVISKSRVFKKAQDGYKSRQGNYPEESSNESSAGKGPSSDYRERQGNYSEKPYIPKTETKTQSDPSKSSNPAPEKTFGQAFAEARKGGGKTFTWRGKSYTTETKEEAAKKAATSVKKEEPKSYSTSTAAKTPEKYTPKSESKSYNLKEDVASQTGKKPYSVNLPKTLPKATPGASKSAPTAIRANKSMNVKAKCGAKVKGKKK